MGDVTERGASPGTMIELDGVSKTYPDGTVAVQELSLTAARGTVTTLVGPSGCGKTTTLKMVNRLVEPSSGRIVIDGEDVTTTDPVQLRRNIGYVIQHVGLFPHRSVADNVATVPGLLGWDADRRRSRTAELLTLVGLDPDVHGRRYPDELSGGQRQRVGVARALAADPPVVLMDEPFSAVDPVVRLQLQAEFLRLQRTLGTTVLFVTHDLVEAVRMGDRMAVFRVGGHLEQVDAPARVLAQPGTAFVEEFVGQDRALTRLLVTDIAVEELAQPAVDGNGFGRPAGPSGADTPGDPDLHGWTLLLDAEGRPQTWQGADGSTVPVGEPLRVGESLRRGMAAALQTETGWVPVLDSDGRYLGTLTPAVVHRTLRRSAGG
jgi:osmoprotectant transport system ATP-binding protein